MPVTEPFDRRKLSTTLATQGQSWYSHCVGNGRNGGAMIICQELMTPLPTCCQPEHTLEEVAVMMKRQDVGAIPVVQGDGSRLVGVVTDRDIVVKAIAEGQAPSQTSVNDVMSADPIFCNQNDPVDAALDLMTVHQIRRIPI